MSKYVIAIDAGGTFFKSAIISDKAEVLMGSLFTTPANNDASPETVRDAYRRTLETQLKTAKKAGIEVSAVAIDTPGPFDYEGGISLMTHKFKAIYNIPLRPWITDVVGDMPVSFIHDSAAFITGEMWYCPYGEYKNAAAAMIGTGLGFATMMDGKVLRKPDGDPLYDIWCQAYDIGDGKEHIAEDFISGKGISARYKPGGRNAKDIEMLAVSGDAEAKQVYADTGRILAEVAAPALNKVGAEIFILGGQISRALPLFEKELREGLASVPTLKKIVRSTRLEYSHMLGAACDCFEKLK